MHTYVCCQTFVYVYIHTHTLATCRAIEREREGVLEDLHLPDHYGRKKREHGREGKRVGGLRTSL